MNSSATLTTENALEHRRAGYEPMEIVVKHVRDAINVVSTSPMIDMVLLLRHPCAFSTKHSDLSGQLLNYDMRNKCSLGMCLRHQMLTVIGFAQKMKTCLPDNKHLTSCDLVLSENSRAMLWQVYRVAWSA